MSFYSTTLYSILPYNPETDCLWVVYANYLVSWCKDIKVTQNYQINFVDTVRVELKYSVCKTGNLPLVSGPYVL